MLMPIFTHGLHVAIFDTNIDTNIYADIHDLAQAVDPLMREILGCLLSPPPDSLAPKHQSVTECHEAQRVVFLVIAWS